MARQEVSTQIPIGPGVAIRRREPEMSETEFQRAVRAAQAVAVHDDGCASRKGKDCGCRDNLRALADGELETIETVTCRWMVRTFRGPTAEERAKGLRSVPVEKEQTAELVRVDGGKTVTRLVQDPVSSTSKKMVEVEDYLPARWICLACAMSFRGTDFDHRCDDADLARVNKPIGLEKTITAETRFGGGYRITCWRDANGDYHIGEEVVVAGRVVEERKVYGPEPFNVIEGAFLDAVSTKLSP